LFAISNLTAALAASGDAPSGDSLGRFQAAAAAVAGFSYLPVLLGLFILIAAGYLLLRRRARKRAQ
jgi:hypothetical protein